MVAAEVKELARQTGEATEDIRGRIERIQQTAGNSVEALSTIAMVVERIHNDSSRVAEDVTTQNANTQDMADRLSNNAEAVASVATSVSQTAEASTEITRSLQVLNEGVQDTRSGAGRTHESGQGVAGKAAQLKELVGQFRV